MILSLFESLLTPFCYCGAPLRYIVTYVNATGDTLTLSSTAASEDTAGDAIDDATDDAATDDAGGKDDDETGMVVLSLLWAFITVGRFGGLYRQVRLSKRCDDEDARTMAAAAATGGAQRRGAAGGGAASAHDSAFAVGTVLRELRLFLGVAMVGGALMLACAPHASSSSSVSRGLWFLGLALFGVGNGPTIGLLFDYANRTTVASEMVWLEVILRYHT